MQWIKKKFLMSVQFKLAYSCKVLQQKTGRANQSILTKRSRCKLNAKKTIAHDNVTWRATARKIVNSQIELTLLILIARLWNFPRNSTIYLHVCSYSATYLLWVTGSTLWRSKARNISSPFPNFIGRNWSKNCAWYHRYAFIEYIPRFVKKPQQII